MARKSITGDWGFGRFNRGSLVGEILVGEIGESKLVFEVGVNNVGARLRLVVVGSAVWFVLSGAVSVVFEGPVVLSSAGGILLPSMSGVVASAGVSFALFVVSGVPNKSGIPETLDDFEWLPGAAVRINPTGVTSLKVFDRPISILPLDCRSLLHVVDCEGCFLCLGESGRFKALSSQVDLVGLQRLGSIVLETTGLVGGSELVSLFSKALAGLVWSSSCGLPGLPSGRVAPMPETGGVAGRSLSLTIVASLWLELGLWLEPGRCVVKAELSGVSRGEDKRSFLLGAAKLFLFPANEWPRLNPDGS